MLTSLIHVNVYLQVVRSILPSVVKTEKSSKSDSPSRYTPPVVETKNPVVSAAEPEALNPPEAPVKCKSPPATAAEARKSPQPIIEDSKGSPKPAKTGTGGEIDNNLVKKETDGERATNGTEEVATSAGAAVKESAEVAGSSFPSEDKVADEAIKAEPEVDSVKRSTTPEKEPEVVVKGATAIGKGIIKEPPLIESKK